MWWWSALSLSGVEINGHFSFPGSPALLRICVVAFALHHDFTHREEPGGNKQHQGDHYKSS